MPFRLVHWGVRPEKGGSERGSSSVPQVWENSTAEMSHLSPYCFKPSHAVRLWVSFSWQFLFFSFILVSFPDLLEMDPGDFGIKSGWHEESKQRVPPCERSHWEVSASAREFSWIPLPSFGQGRETWTVGLKCLYHLLEQRAFRHSLALGKGRVNLETAQGRNGAFTHRRETGTFLCQDFLWTLTTFCASSSGPAAVTITKQVRPFIRMRYCNFFFASSIKKCTSQKC